MNKELANKEEEAQQNQDSQKALSPLIQKDPMSIQANQSCEPLDTATLEKKLTQIIAVPDIAEYSNLVPQIKKKTELPDSLSTLFLDASLKVNRSSDLIKVMTQFKNDEIIISLFKNLSICNYETKDYTIQKFADFEDSLFILSEYLSKDLEVCFNYLSQATKDLIWSMYPLFSLVLHILSKNAKLKEAKILLDYLMHNKLEISTCAINNFIDALCKDTQLESAQSLFETLSNYKPELVFPENSFKFNKYIIGHGVNIVTYGTFIKWLCKSNNMELAMYYYNFLKNGNFLKDEIIYNLIIDGCAKKGDLPTIKSVYFNMLNDSIKPTIVTFNTIIDAFVRAKDLDSAWKIFEDLLKNNIQPDNFTLSTLFRGIRTPIHKQYLLKGLDIVKKISLENNQSADIILINVLLDSCIALKESELLIQLFKDVISGKIKDVSPDLITYNTFIKGCAQMGIYNEVMPAFEEMCKNKSVKPNDVTFNTLIDVFVRSKDMNKVWFTISRMKEMNIKPDNFTYSTIIKGLNRNTNLNCNNEESQDENELDLAFKLFENVKKNSKPDEILYNCIMDACLRFGKIDRMLDLYDNMLFEGIKPSSITCGIVIKAYGMKGQIDKAIQVYEQMKVDKTEISSVTFGCLINACIKNDRMEKALELYEELQNNGFEMNTILYTTLIKAYSKEKNLQKVLNIFNKMKQSSNNMPNNITYNSVIDCCLKNDDYKLADNLFNEMCNLQDVKPDIITFSTLIKGSLRSKNFDQAMSYLNIMLKMKIKPDEVFLNSLLDGCEKLSQYDKAINIFNTIKGLGVEPTMMSYSIMMKILGKICNYEFSKILMEEVKSKKKNLSLIIFTCYIKTCFSTGHLEDACETFMSLESYKLEPDAIAYSTFIKGITSFYSNNDFSSYLINVIKQSAEKKINLQRYHYISVIKYLKNYGHYNEASELAKYLEERKLLQPRENYSNYKGKNQMNMNTNSKSNAELETATKTPIKKINFFNENSSNSKQKTSGKLELTDYSYNPKRKICNFQESNSKSVNANQFINQNDNLNVSPVDQPEQNENENSSSMPLNSIWERKPKNYNYASSNVYYSSSTKPNSENYSNYYNANANTAKKTNASYQWKNNMLQNGSAMPGMNYQTFNSMIGNKTYFPNYKYGGNAGYFVSNFNSGNYVNYNNFNFKQLPKVTSKVINYGSNFNCMGNQSEAKKEDFVESQNLNVNEMAEIDEEITDEYDKEFIALIMEIERLTLSLKKHDQLRIKSWCKKLCQITNNTEWKKNRNLHAICLLDNILNQRFDDPYNKFAPEGFVPIINKTIVKSKLSPAFLKHSINFSKIVNNFLYDNYQGVELNNNQLNPLNNDYSDINDESTLVNLINKVKIDNQNKDKIIQILKNENLQLNKRIQELEKEMIKMSK